MKSKFSTTWKGSVQPRKQRKYRHKAPLHVKSTFLAVNLSKELRKKHGRRSVRVRVGDKVKVMRGSFRKREGKVEEVNMRMTKVYVTGLEVSKMEGSKSRVPLSPSNLQIVDLNLDDKRRKAKLSKATEVKKNG